MNQLTDVQTRVDVELLVNTFYDRVKADEVIGYIFNEIIGQDWSHHLPVMYMFWETILLQKPGYMGNPVGKHIEIDRRIALKQEHFDRWLQLWHQTVDDLFSGTIAEEAKKRAGLMIELIKMKVDMARNNKTIL
jgi:hemoglobin